MEILHKHAEFSQKELKKENLLDKQGGLKGIWDNEYVFYPKRTDQQWQGVLDERIIR